MKNRFSRWQQQQSSWISDLNEFSYFRSTSHPNVSENQLAFWFRRRSKKIGFQDGGRGDHLGFPIRMIFVIFDLQVTPMFPTKFQS